MRNHPWKLVGPWYRSHSLGGVASHRQSAPIIQKYAATTFANALVDEPQASLKFTSEDFVERITFDPDQVIELPQLGSNPKPLKLFLDIHSRYYIVVTELHCDVPGFPSANRDEVCEAGFVVRRHIPVVPEEASAKVAKNRAELQVLSTQLLKLGAHLDAHECDTMSVSELMKVNARKLKNLYQSRQLERLQKNIDVNRREFDTLVAEFDLGLKLQGWIPGETPSTGSWQEVSEEPEELIETVIPMYPLVADPTKPSHSATGRTLWFGVIPTNTNDVDVAKRSRFEDNVLYDARCFVRRHKPECPKKRNERDCAGELIWSRPTDSFQLASAYDLDGHSHKSISMRMPDLKAIQAQSSLGPPGRGVSLAAVTPEDGGLYFTPAGMDMPKKDPAGGAAEICFYFPLLFFIVAYFLFQIILPILMFVLQLWFLLKLKICIPPSIGIDGRLAADLKMQGDIGVKLDSGVGVEFGFEADGITKKVFSDADVLRDTIAETIADGISLAEPFKTEFKDTFLADAALDVDDMRDLLINLGTDFTDDSVDPVIAGELPDPERGLVYFHKVLNP